MVGTDAVDNPILRAALEYAGIGWKVVPLYGITAAGTCECHKGAACRNPGKHPRINEWEKEATTDEEKIFIWWKRWPHSNVGVQMGEESGLVDAECDSEAADLMMLSIFGGEFPHTPTFQSKRGKHRLMRWSGELPQAKATFRIGEIDFKIGGGEKGSQSVFPPSRRADGSEYKWLIHPSEAELASFKPTAIAKIWNYEPGAGGGEAKPKEHWDKIAKGTSEGERNATAAQWIGRLLSDLKNPFDNSAIARLWDLVDAWNSRNSPPLDSGELKATFESILRRHRESWTADEHAAAVEKYVDRGREDGKPSSAPWRIVKVLAKPIRWEMYSPLWEHSAPGGFIILNSEQVLSDRKVTLQALEQAGIPLGPDFKYAYNGTKKAEGLMSQMIRNCTVKEATAEEKRDMVIAELLLEQLRRARSSEQPDHRGGPCRLPDGSITFKFSLLLQQMQFSMANVEHGEVVECLKKIGARNHAFKINGVALRLKVLSQQQLEELERLIFADSVAQRDLLGEKNEG